MRCLVIVTADAGWRHRATDVCMALGCHSPFLISHPKEHFAPLWNLACGEVVDRTDYHWNDAS